MSENGKIQSYIDYVMVIEGVNSNMNGDPSFAGGPRLVQSPEFDNKEIAIMTDVSVKHHARVNIQSQVQMGKLDWKILHNGEGCLNDKVENLFTKDTNESEKEKLILQKYIDAVLFGFLIPKHAGIRSPIHCTFFETLFPVELLPISITKWTPTKMVKKTKRTSANNEEDAEETETGKMGSKVIIRYGLYRGVFSVNPHFAAKTGLNNELLILLENALKTIPDLMMNPTRQEVNLISLHKLEHTGCNRNMQLGDVKRLVEAKLKREENIPRCTEDIEEIIIHKSKIQPNMKLTSLCTPNGIVKEL